MQSIHISISISISVIPYVSTIIPTQIQYGFGKHKINNVNKHATTNDPKGQRSESNIVVTNQTDVEMWSPFKHPCCWSLVCNINEKNSHMT